MTPESHPKATAGCSLLKAELYWLSGVVSTTLCTSLVSTKHPPTRAPHTEHSLKKGQLRATTQGTVPKDKLFPLCWLQEASPRQGWKETDLPWLLMPDRSLRASPFEPQSHVLRSFPLRFHRTPEGFWLEGT